MFRQRRLLKREKLRVKVKLVFVLLVVLLITAIGLEFLYFNFTSVSVISPLAKSKSSKLANLESELSRAKVVFSSVAVNSDGSFAVKLLDGGEVILSSKKDVGSQLSSLQLMLASLTIEGKKLKVLDFRFDNPVVSF
jgi:cell division septal protein FtsQ